MSVHVTVCTHVWRPEIDTVCLPQLLSTLFLRQGLSLNHWSSMIVWISWPMSSICLSLFHLPWPPVLGSQTYAAEPASWYECWGIWTQVLMLGQPALYWLNEPCLQPLVRPLAYTEKLLKILWAWSWRGLISKWVLVDLERGLFRTQAKMRLLSSCKSHNLVHKAFPEILRDLH